MPKPPSLLSQFLGTADKPDDDAPDEADDTAPHPGVAAAQSVLDALDSNDRDALAEALGAALDIHTADDGDARKPDVAAPSTKPPPLAIHVHVHGA